MHAKLLYLDHRAIGYCQYGKLSSLSRSLERRKQFKTPASQNAIIITCVSVQKELRGKGLGTTLLASVVKELVSKGTSVIEACVQKPYSERFSSGPERLYVKCGFILVEELPYLSLMSIKQTLI